MKTRKRFLFPKKSFWQDRQARVFHFYCPQCRAERRAPMHPRPDRPLNYLRIALTAAVFTLATWNWFGWKGLVSFIPLWAGFETFYRTRVRGELSCSQCGFDPYLYLTDVQRARDEIDIFWKRTLDQKGVPYTVEKGRIVQQGPPGSKKKEGAGSVDESPGSA